MARPPAGFAARRGGPRGQSRSWPECCPQGPRRPGGAPALLSGRGLVSVSPGAWRDRPGAEPGAQGVGLALPLSRWRTRLGARLRPTSLGGGASPRPRARRWAPSQRRESRGKRRAAGWVTGVPLASRRRMLVVEVANGRSLVWGAEAVQALRERLGVGGRTVGALPRGPRQNSRLGLPLLLMPEEARLLAEIGAVTLVSAPRPDPRQHSLVRGGQARGSPPGEPAGGEAGDD